MIVSRSALLDGLPPGRPVAAGEVAALARGRVLVVLDDDPTGSQSVADLPVLLRWDAESMEWALRAGAPAVYVLTNTRSLSPTDAERRTREVVRAALAAATRVGIRVGFASRSDSTLRGHFPLETDILAEELAAATGEAIDGLVLVPAFPDAGRITVGSVHYAGDAADGYTPVGQTEFARDATFGYFASDLSAWVAEKATGRHTSEGVARIDLTTLRTDPAGTLGVLLGLGSARPVVVDIVEENDLRLLAIALYAAQQQGARLLFRVGPPFVRAFVGQEVPAPVGVREVSAIRRTRPSEGARGGLVVVGSHVSLTTRQVERLIDHDHPMEVELDVAAVLSDGDEGLVRALARRVAEGIAEGNVVLRTSRVLVRADDAETSLGIARRVSDAVVEVVRQVVELAGDRPPRFVVAKGGITSSDVATHGLSIERAMVRGPMLPGIVSLWEPMTGPARGIPYVVFAGNVGDVDSLAEVVVTLSG